MKNVKIAELYEDVLYEIKRMPESEDMLNAFDQYVLELARIKIDEHNKLTDIIKQIAEPSGAYNRDMLIYVTNTLESCMKLAQEALDLINKK